MKATQNELRARAMTLIGELVAATEEARDGWTARTYATQLHGAARMAARLGLIDDAEFERIDEKGDRLMAAHDATHAEPPALSAYLGMDPNPPF